MPALSIEIIDKLTDVLHGLASPDDDLAA